MPENRIYTREYYEKAYRMYDRQNPDKKLDFYRGLIQSAIHYNSRPRILDVGCAFGKLLSRLDSSWDLFGIELSEYAAGKAREALPHGHVAISSVAQIPFDGFFDVITAFDVLEHLDDLKQAESSIASKLKPDGAVIFVVPVYDGPLSPMIRILDKDETHVQRHSRNFWLEWVGGHFHLESWRGILRYLLPGGFYIHWPTRIFRNWAPAIAVVARKK